MIGGDSFELLLLAHTAATLFMTGLIWFVQIVHYPLFAVVPAGGFAAYENNHVRRTTWVVAPVMLAEAVTGCLLFAASPTLSFGINVALLGVIWLSTLLLQVPQHRLLEQGLDPRAHRVLVQSNWVRTAAWSLRSLILLLVIVGRMA